MEMASHKLLLIVKLHFSQNQTKVQPSASMRFSRAILDLL